MKIVLIPDSLKESLSAFEVAEAMANGIRKVLPDAEIISCPLADGGEGTVDALVHATGGYKIEVFVHDPLMRSIKASYGILGDHQTAVIETASASGLALLNKQERNPMITTSFGTGELIVDALNKGIRKFIIGLGGSGINDGGAGMAQALGVNLLDAEGKKLQKGGGPLIHLAKIDISEIHEGLKTAEFNIASDVTNPLTGSNGASRIFGPQKGATEEMVTILDESLTHYASVIKKQMGKEIANIAGAGAAGGLGAGILAFCSGVIKSGFPLIAEFAMMEDKLENADIIFTAEGKSDIQTLSGKLPYGVGKTGQKYGIPVFLLTGYAAPGSEELLKHGVTSIMPFQNGPMTLTESVNNAFSLISQTSANVLRIFLAGRK
ncbi:glycerate kinase [Sporocytophaga myxococcoides]|uniref:glycerate kinase n=1 Tax=Sporocytophaga myxococcoides TaxID=153721 RepID=UPI00048C752A|nr:glycerate kinase [Sporocytophaga myxococcoides]